MRAVASGIRAHFDTIPADQALVCVARAIEDPENAAPHLADLDELRPALSANATLPWMLDKILAACLG